MVKRLTKTYSNGYVTINAEGFHQSQETIDNEVRNSEAFTAAVMRLKEYEDAEEQALLLKLPCSVGSTVYKICPVSKYLQIGEMRDGKIIETDCQRCAFRVCDCFNIGFMKNALNIIREIKAPDELWILKRKPYFGEIYFTTRKEAEQALKGGVNEQ